MTFTDLPYTHTDEEFEEMRALLSQSYLEERRPRNWRLALAENWAMGSRFLEPKEYFTSRVRLWRNGDGELAGFLIRGNMLVHPEVRYCDSDLVDEMLDWAEENWSGEGNNISALAYDWDEERQQQLTKRGYKNQKRIEEVRIYDLGRDYPEPELPDGFRIRSMKEVGDPQARVYLENNIWDASLDMAWFKGKSSAPSYSLDLDLVAVSPSGKLAASSLVWLYPTTRTAEIDPLGTHPEFRRLGLARAMVLESFKHMQAHDMQYAYIASDTQNNAINRLYSSLRPVETYYGYLWTRKMDAKV